MPCSPAPVEPALQSKPTSSIALVAAIIRNTFSAFQRLPPEIEEEELRKEGRKEGRKSAAGISKISVSRPPSSAPRGPPSSAGRRTEGGGTGPPARSPLCDRYCECGLPGGAAAVLPGGRVALVVTVTKWQRGLFFLERGQLASIQCKVAITETLQIE